MIKWTRLMITNVVRTTAAAKPTPKGSPLPVAANDNLSGVVNVKKELRGANDNQPLSGKQNKILTAREELLPEDRQDSTSRNNNYGISKVARTLRRIPNGRLPIPKTTDIVPRVFDNDNVQKAQKMALRAQRLAKATPAVITAATIPYTIQVAFAVICLVGFGILGGLDASNLLSAADLIALGTGSALGEALFVIGLVGALMCGNIIAALSAPALKAVGAHPGEGFSIPILAFCNLLHLVPILNLFPIMALWCLYVALSE